MHSRAIFAVVLFAGTALGSACRPVGAGVAPGAAAPPFELVDTSGRKHGLAAYRGKYVVLEWLNHGCPFVKGHYEIGNMQALQRDFTARGVVWLSVNSSAAGKQGHYAPAAANELTRAKGAVPSAVLLDWDGKVGRLYGAKTTPHMFVIDPQGRVVYNGALDDNRSARKSAQDIARATNYVRLALEQSMSGKPVEIKSTIPYGCSVKYK